ncbi:L-seryl-tRNA(Ser) seleniumtransferase [Neorhodopirellula lusitana]|uniref:L-seryl-tRNA(Ser) seleniumtransferase n=1 Tax=Neorhodopirellula lusitana TaxID=445327 RepID=A0ABY1Q705_9BACT|nr:hypothetical protein [Neorhodopirellula lusitana]SMP61711.1 L-seryl-tRNA(Ser) seleniumtransferase [Neorhodopirellula lusitana]
MALPPWTIELLRRGVQDIARQATDPETAASLKEQASKLVDDLPRVAREKVDTLLRQAESSTRPLKDAWNRGEFFTGSWWNAASDGTVPVRLINGSGTLLHPLGSGVPLSAGSLSAAIPFLSGDGAHVTGIDAALCKKIAGVFVRKNPAAEAGAEGYSVAVTSSFDSAIALVALLGGPGAKLHVPRKCAVPLPSGASCSPGTFDGDGSSAGANGGSTPPNQDRGGMLAERLGAFARGGVSEFGSISSDEAVRISDMQLDGGPRRHGRPNDRGPRFAERRAILVRLAGTTVEGDRPEGMVEVVVLPVGSCFDLPSPNSTNPDNTNSSGSDSANDNASVTADITRSVQAELAAGADVVVLAGGTLSGTPDVGIVVGKTNTVARMIEHDRARWLMADTAKLAMVANAVAEQASGKSPVHSLLTASEDNLRDRAERLATQLSGSTYVTSVRVSDDHARIGPEDQASIPSRQVVVSLRDDAHELATRLLKGPTGLLLRPSGNDLAIDLRWISPEQQSRISDLFA